MKKLTALFLLAITVSYGQISFYNPSVKEKDVKKGLVTFETFTNSEGDVSYGFRKDGLIVGPNMVLHSDGKITYQNYSKDHLLEGVQVIMDKQSGSIELYTYEKSEKNGPSFKMEGGKPTATNQYKNGKIDPKGFKVETPGKYVRIKGDGLSGFSMEEYDNKSYALGYFKYGYRFSPIIHVWQNGDSYYGQYANGVRYLFGLYAYNSGSKYVGLWDGDREGLGFMVNKDGEVYEKGYYKDGELKIEL